MKKFWIRMLNVAIIIAMLYGYDVVTAERVAADDLVKAEEAAAIAAASYDDGTYQGTATGFGGDITVEVTIEDNAIVDITIVSAANEDSAYLSMAKGIIDRIISAQSTDVDTVSGATFSSTGIRNAVANALDSAH